MAAGEIRVENVSKRFILGTAAGARDLREIFSPRFRSSAPSEDGENSEEFWAVKDVSFEVKPGESVGIIGHNGSGKSTILKMLTGILKPTSGQISVEGRVGGLIEVGAGFHPDLTGRENVFLNASIMGMSRQEAAKQFDEIVAFAELERFIDTPVKRYSSGMYMRLGFAIVAHIAPQVLLIDEVLAVGDMAFQNKCMNRVREIASQGATVVFVSHSMDAVARICNRAILMDKGVIKAQGPTQVVIDSHFRDMNAHVEAQYVKEDAQAAAKLAKEREEKEKNPPLRFTNIELLNASGETSRLFRTGDSLTLRAEYEADRTIEDCVFGFGITRVDGVHCAGPNTRLDNFPLKVGPGRGVFEATLPDVGLLADTYQIAVCVLEGEDVVEYRDGLCRFVMNNDSGESGLVRMERHWRHNTERPAPVPVGKH